MFQTWPHTRRKVPDGGKCLEDHTHRFNCTSKVSSAPMSICSQPLEFIGNIKAIGNRFQSCRAQCYALYAIPEFNAIEQEV